MRLKCECCQVRHPDAYFCDKNLVTTANIHSAKKEVREGWQMCCGLMDDLGQVLKLNQRVFKRERQGGEIKKYQMSESNCDRLLAAPL